MRSLERYYAVMTEFGRNPGNLRFEQQTMFKGVSFGGASVLDIGGGDGVTSLFAAAAGAARVVSLSHEGDGSWKGAATTFEQLRDKLDLDQVAVVRESIQDYDPAGERFDVLISRASINHVDEDACVRLRHDADAQERYMSVFQKLAGLSAPRAAFVIKDAMPKNFFGALGLRNPMMPTLEWHKHQQPELWAEMLSRAGFVEPSIRWVTLNTLRSPGQLLLGNRLCSYFMLSTFVLTARRA